MRTSDTLNLAADLIQTRGWLGGTAVDDELDPWGGGAAGTGPVCLEGGILAALGVTLPDWALDTIAARRAILAEFYHCPAYLAVHRYLELPENERVYAFNDAGARTATEVVEVLRAAAVVEAAREDAAILAQMGGAA